MLLSLSRNCSRAIANRGFLVPRVRFYAQITTDDIASVLKDDDKLGLKNLVRIFGKIRDKGQRQTEIRRHAAQHQWAPHAFNEALLKYASASNPVMAEEVLNVMKDIEATEGKKLISVDTYNALLSGYCNAGQMSTAQNLLKEMQDNAFDTGYISYSLLVNGYANSNQDDMAIQTMREMEKRDLQIGVEVIEAIVSVLVRLGKLEKAVQITKEHTEKHHLPIPPNALVSILGGYKETKERVKEGVKFLKEAKEKGSLILPRMWTTLIINCGKVGDAEQAFELYKEMEQDGVEPDMYTYNALIHVCDKKNLVEKAFEFLEIMKQKNIEVTGETIGSLEAVAMRCKRSDLYRQHCGDNFFLQRPPPV